MKKFLFLVVGLIGFLANAQADKIYKHNGEVIDGKVVKLEEFTIIFKYDGEDAENTLSKYAIEKIVYGKSRMILVAGGSGVGKTALVNEVKKPITEHNGNFYSGKFDQMNKKIPYSSVVQALSVAIEEIMNSPQRDA